MASILRQLSEAVRSEDDTQLTQLLASNPGININGVISRTKGGRLIHLAALKPAALTPLLTHPLIDVNLKNNSGETAFFIASRAGVTHTVQMLLRCERIDVLAANAKGQTPLWVLAKEGRYKLVKEVLDLAGDELSQGDLQAALAVAKQLNRRRVVTILEERVALVANPDANVPPERELYRAILSENLPAATQLLQMTPSLYVNWHNPHEHGFTALHAAAYYGLEEFVELLLQQPGIDVNAVSDVSQSLPLFFACRENKLEAVRLLVLDPRTRVNSPNNTGRTSLWIAAREGHINIVRFLINERPDDYNPEGPQVEGAIAIARQHNKRRVVEYLERERGIQEINTFFIAQTEAGVSVLDHYNRILTQLDLPPGRSLAECKRRYQESGRIINIYDYMAWVQELLHNPDAQLRTFTWVGFLSDITNNRSRIFPLQRAKEENLKLLLVQWSGRR